MTRDLATRDPVSALRRGRIPDLTKVKTLREEKLHTTNTTVTVTYTNLISRM